MRPDDDRLLDALAQRARERDAQPEEDHAPSPLPPARRDRLIAEILHRQRSGEDATDPSPGEDSADELDGPPFVARPETPVRWRWRTGLALAASFVLVTSVAVWWFAEAADPGFAWPAYQVDIDGIASQERSFRPPTESDPPEPRSNEPIAEVTRFSAGNRVVLRLRPATAVEVPLVVEAWRRSSREAPWRPWLDAEVSDQGAIRFSTVAGSRDLPVGNHHLRVVVRVDGEPQPPAQTWRFEWSVEPELAVPGGGEP